MNCKGCLNKTECRGVEMSVVRQCPKCKKLAAHYRYNDVGNLVFDKCIYCGYNAKDYLKDLCGDKNSKKCN